MTKSKGVIIVSGGADSTTLMYQMRNQLEIALSFNYGQNHTKELEYAKYHANKLKLKHMEINISNVYKGLPGNTSALLDGKNSVPTLQEVIGSPQPITYVPFRNGLFLTIAAIYAEGYGCDSIYYGAQAHDSYSGYFDTTPTYVDAFQKTLLENRKHKITLKAPFVNLSKSDIFIIGKKLKIDYSKTMTCYKGIEPACGTCPTCIDRITNFARAGMIDGVKYAVKINWDVLLKAHNTKKLQYNDIIKKLIK